MRLRKTNGTDRKTPCATVVGHGVDPLHDLICTFVPPAFILGWCMTKAEAGYSATDALVSAAAGGRLPGIPMHRHEAQGRELRAGAELAH